MRIERLHIGDTRARLYATTTAHLCDAAKRGGCFGQGSAAHNLQSSALTAEQRRGARRLALKPPSRHASITSNLTKRSSQRQDKWASAARSASASAPALTPEPGSTTEIDADDPLGGLSEGDVGTTIRTLEVLGRDAALFKSRPFKKLRAALAPCALAFVGQDATDDRQRRKLERPVQDEDERRRVMDRDAKNRTALRKERLDRLETAGLVADGPALAPQLLLTDGKQEDSLNSAVACYAARAPFSELHHFYAALCPRVCVPQFRKADADGGSERPGRARDGRARQDRVSRRAEITKGRRDGRRDVALPRRRGPRVTRRPMRKTGGPRS